MQASLCRPPAHSRRRRKGEQINRDVQDLLLSTHRSSLCKSRCQRSQHLKTQATRRPVPAACSCVTLAAISSLVSLYSRARFLPSQPSNHLLILESLFTSVQVGSEKSVGFQLGMLAHVNSPRSPHSTEYIVFTNTRHEDRDHCTDCHAARCLRCPGCGLDSTALKALPIITTRLQ